ncbi:MAG: DUF2147 domain-containing protein [Methyloligellaceae bacterium]
MALIVALSGWFSDSAKAIEASLATGSAVRGPSKGGSAIGKWITTGGKSMVQVRPCGSRLCSTLVWLKRPFDSHGRPLRDRRNRNTRLRNRRIIGIPILQALKPAGRGRWRGRVYNPEDGGTYRVNIFVRSATRLEVRGCAASGWPCRSRFWRRTGRINAQRRPVRTRGSSLKPFARR